MTDWLLGTLLATSGLIVLVLLIREPVRHHFGARVAYGLWLIPAARLLMPTITQTVERAIPAPAPTPYFAPQLVSEPLLLATVAPAEPTLIEQLGGWPAILFTLWFGGALGLFLTRMLAFRRERAAILADAIALGRIGSIRLVQSAEVSGPLAFGIIDRVIAVPAEFERLYGPRERRLALEHEFAHHRAGDLFANFFAFVLLCLQWFNPLAWVAHAAYRFDQEAACDARVLDKVKAHDRADYGRAIAKAASGRALLFASALDRRKTLHRRLKSMLTNPTAGRRFSGRLMVLATVAVALPLTATRAVNFVDVPQVASRDAPAAPAAPVMAAVQAFAAPASPPLAPAPPVPPTPPEKQLHIDGEGKIMINGHEKHWKDLTPAEKAEIRRSIAKAKEELAKTRIDREKIQREIREAMEETRIDREELRRDLDEARVEFDVAMREIDARAADIRRSGQDPEQIKAQVRASLRAVEAIDVEAITRRALASVDHQAIDASVREAQASFTKAHAEIERLEQQFRDD